MTAPMQIWAKYLFTKKMLQSDCKITEIGVSNNKPQMVIYFQEQEFPTIMEKK